MKKLALVFGVMVFSGAALAQEEKPSWTFGCKFDAQKQEQVAQVKTVSEVNKEERNTWTFDDSKATVISMK